MVVRRIYKTLVVIPVVLLLVALLFRATLYWSIPVADDEPYGGGDILEIILFLLIILFSLAAALYATILAVVPKLREKKYILRLLLVGALVPMLYFILHPLMPKLG